jgi:hypothetical protein
MAMCLSQERLPAGEPRNLEECRPGSARDTYLLERPTLFSFERPRLRVRLLLCGRPPRVDLEICIVAINEREQSFSSRTGMFYRQDIKGVRWMPWHQEPKKDVDGCDKPR